MSEGAYKRNKATWCKLLFQPPLYAAISFAILGLITDLLSVSSMFATGDPKLMAAAVSRMMVTSLLLFVGGYIIFSTFSVLVSFPTIYFVEKFYLPKITPVTVFIGITIGLIIFSLVFFGVLTSILVTSLIYIYSFWRLYNAIPKPDDGQQE